MKRRTENRLYLLIHPFHIKPWPPGELRFAQIRAQTATTDIIPKQTALENMVTKQLREENSGGNVCKNS